jgi:hypothetical protein
VFKTKFRLEQIDDKYFRLLSDLVYESEKYGLKIRVPEGFVSDGPSVPRVPLLYFLFGNKGKRAAVIHDWLYRNALVSREVADAIFKEALYDTNKGAYTAWGMYLGVRGFGWPSYGSRPGCLDMRFKCDLNCKQCKNSFLAYQLSCIKMYR